VYYRVGDVLTTKERAAYATLPLVRYARPNSSKGGGGWAYGRILEVTPHGVHIILDHKGTKHKITATDVERDVTTVAEPTQLAQRKPRRIGA
jgi:hypothetical protein